MGEREKDLAGRGKVLVVDDSAVVRALVGGCLRKAAFEVVEADDGITALQLLRTSECDVVITDINMPKMGGLAMIAQIRAQALSPEVIILTGSRAQDVECAVEALRLGAHDYLTKPPANPEAIVRAVERALEKKRLRDENARLLKELRKASLTDPLTGLPNRRAFEDALGRERARARRQGTTLSLVLFDLDHFKDVNDTLGHDGGDEVLRHFARTVSGLLRGGDALYRVGGEEFAALLPDTTPTGALEAAARILGAVATRPVRYHDAMLSVTSSAGVACTNGEESHRVVADADAALYQAKRGGRNRVFLPLPQPARQMAMAS
jgi:diguanylate cyclase (GGDEF)-like protein